MQVCFNFKFFFSAKYEAQRKIPSLAQFFYEDTLLQNSHLKAPCARFKKAELYGLEIALPTHYLLGNAPFSLYGASLLYTQCYIPYLHTVTIFSRIISLQAFLDLCCQCGDTKRKPQKQKPHKLRLLSSTKGVENRIEL